MTRPTCVIDCNNFALYGERNNPVRCRIHKLETDVLADTHKYCCIAGCTKNKARHTNRHNEWFCIEHSLTEETWFFTDDKCAYDGCTNHIEWGIEPLKPLRCTEHKLATDVDVVHGRGCCHPGCTVDRVRLPSEDGRRYCGTHRPSDIKKVFKNACRACGEHQAVWGPEKGNPERCRKHRTETDILLVYDHRTCVTCIEKKVREPTRGTYTKESKHYCDIHKPKEYGRTVPQCVKCPKGDKKRAYYPELEGGALIYCGDHKPEGSKPIPKKKCEHQEAGIRCDVSAKFGYKYGNRIMCKAHKKDDMHDVEHKRCIYEDERGRCRVEPIWGLSKEEGVKWCKKHKPKEAMDLKNIYCTIIGCEKIARYGTTVFEYTHCSDHREIGTIYCRDKLCEVCKLTVASYGPPGQLLRCKRHMLVEDVDNRSTKCVEHINHCKQQASFGYPGGSPIACRHHKAPDMISLYHPLCTNCDDRYTNIKYEPYCFRCWCDINEVEDVARLHRCKEYAVKTYLAEMYPELKIDHNMGLGPSRCRPDFLAKHKLEEGVYCIIIEVDEFQHSLYTDENMRKLKITKELSPYPVWFIRFNPDMYRDTKGIVYPGCFEGEGKDPDDPAMWQQRLAELSKALNKCLSTYPDEDNVIHLFYSTL